MSPEVVSPEFSRHFGEFGFQRKCNPVESLARICSNLKELQPILGEAQDFGMGFLRRNPQCIPFVREQHSTSERLRQVDYESQPEQDYVIPALRVDRDAAWIPDLEQALDYMECMLPDPDAFDSILYRAWSQIDTSQKELQALKYT